MRRATIGLILVVQLSACFQQDVGSNGALSIQPSNGVLLADGIDPDHVTTLSGSCGIAASSGKIECDDFIVRLNRAGVSDGIGYERFQPSAETCAGEAGATPWPIAVFSFGSLVIEEGTRVRVTLGPNGSAAHDAYAVALVAAKTIDVRGELYIETGGYPAHEDATLSGPSPGAILIGPGTGGASGAGGSTEGGGGGNDGAPRTPAVPAQFEPLCGGSGGGFVGDYCDGLLCFSSVGGDGGGAAILAAGDAITIDGPAPCGVFANGGGGIGGGYQGGSGGGSGGTLSLESPRIAIGANCWVTAVGGGGRGGGCSTPDESAEYCGAESGEAPESPGDVPAGGVGGLPDGGRGGNGAYLDLPAEDGADGGQGGGGGGGAGFIRLRTRSCDTSPPMTSPPASCEVL